MNKKEKNIFIKAINTYGADEQMRVAQEECAELIQALSKYHRAFASEAVKVKKDHRYIDRAKKNVKEELVDVGIMLDQLTLIFGFEKTDLEEFRKERIERLADRLQSVEEE